MESTTLMRGPKFRPENALSWLNAERIFPLRFAAIISAPLYGHLFDDRDMQEKKLQLAEQLGAFAA